MKKTPEASRLCRSLEQEEIEFLKESVKKDHDLVQLFRKLVVDGKRNVFIATPDDVTYSTRRAYADGQLRELEWMESILTWRE